MPALRDLDARHRTGRTLLRWQRYCGEALDTGASSWRLHEFLEHAGVSDPGMSVLDVNIDPEG
jgi:hypothetical protein